MTIPLWIFLAVGWSIFGLVRIGHIKNKFTQYQKMMRARLFKSAEEYTEWSAITEKAIDDVEWWRRSIAAVLISAWFTGCIKFGYWVATVVM